MYKTHLDFASPYAYSQAIQRNMDVKLVGTRAGTGIDKSPISTHSLEHFVGQGSLSVERNTMLASMKNSLGTVANVANVGVQGYFLEQDIEKHLKMRRLP